MTIQTVCVYCGSRAPEEKYVDIAYRTGQAIGQAGKDLVYGGSCSGLMGIIADAVIQHGGKVTGVIPHHIQDIEEKHLNITENIMVDTMHERKQIMVNRADAFVALPGGFGTLEEAFEIITWRQLGLHDKPILFMNVHGYWDHIIQLRDHIIGTGFADPSHAELFDVVNDPDQIIGKIEGAPEPKRATNTEWV